MKTEVVQKAVLISPKGKMLLLRRSASDERRPKQWDLVGGLLEEGESYETGIKREILEESGLEAKSRSLVFAKTEASEWQQDGLKKSASTIRLYYVARVAETKVTLSFEHDDFLWASIEEALNLLEYPRHKAVLQYIIDNSIEL